MKFYISRSSIWLLLKRLLCNPVDRVPVHRIEICNLYPVLRNRAFLALLTLYLQSTKKNATFWTPHVTGPNGLMQYGYRKLCLTICRPDLSVHVLWDPFYQNIDLNKQVSGNRSFLSHWSLYDRYWNSERWFFGWLWKRDSEYLILSLNTVSVFVCLQKPWLSNTAKSVQVPAKRCYKITCVH